jgi:hypothetical protein
MRCPHLFAAITVGLVLIGSGGCGGRSMVSTTSPLNQVSPSGAPLAPPAPSAGASSAGTPGAGPSGNGPSGAGPSGNGPSGSGSAGAADETAAVVALRTAVADVRGRNLTFLLGDGIAKADGRYDAATGFTRLARIQDGRLYEMNVIGEDLYLGGFTPDGTVMKVVVAGLPGGNDLLPVALPLATLSLLSGVTKADVSVNNYSGRLDLARVVPGADMSMRRFLAYLVQQAGDRAGDIAFTATVDGFGRLASFHAVFPKADGGHDLEYTFDIRGIGVPVAVSAPTAAVTDAPGAIYATGV